MRDDEIELRKAALGRVGQVTEGQLMEMRVGQAGAAGQAAAAFDVGGVEVEAMKFAGRIGGGEDVDRQPVAAAQLGPAERAGDVGRALAQQHGGGRQPARRDLTIKTSGIGDVKHVAVIPGGHGRLLRGSLDAKDRPSRD